jgi:hypothetical protein
VRRLLQLWEPLTRNDQVSGSSPLVGSRGGRVDGQLLRGKTVYYFDGLPLLLFVHLCLGGLPPLLFVHNVYAPLFSFTKGSLPCVTSSYTEEQYWLVEATAAPYSPSCREG